MVTKESLKIFWALFTSLVDDSTEPVNLKMARRRQCLTGNAWEAIRGLGVTVHEYEEAKEILKTKYGGTRRGSASLLGSTRTGAGEVEDGTLHSLRVKKLPDRQLENYSRWLNERAR